MDSVPKVSGELAVGANLQFQRRWWRVEQLSWISFSVVVLLSLTGLTGRGYLSRATISASDGILSVDYERIERFDTPSILKVTLTSAPIRDGRVFVWVDRKIIDDLGNQRIVPQPAASNLRSDGLIYEFAAAGTVQVEFQLQPSQVGFHRIRVGQPGKPPLSASMLVLP